MITSSSRNCADIYTAIITDMQNPLTLRFRYREEAVEFQRIFSTGLEQHNYNILSSIEYMPKDSEKYDYTLTMWK